MDYCPKCGREIEVISFKGSEELYYSCEYCDFLEKFDEEEEGDSLSVYDAALIWASNGEDEDYTFGYSEDELEDALNS